MFGNNDDSYDDIINMQHHVSKKRPAMSIHDRAAQFSAFAALSGHDDAVKETERLTQSRSELGSDALDELDNKLKMIEQVPVEKRKPVKISFFIPDDVKSGGSYSSVNGVVTELDSYNRTITMSDGTVIGLDLIMGIDL